MNPRSGNFLSFEAGRIISTGFFVVGTVSIDMILDLRSVKPFFNPVLFFDLKQLYEEFLSDSLRSPPLLSFFVRLSRTAERDRAWSQSYLLVIPSFLHGLPSLSHRHREGALPKQLSAYHPLITPFSILDEQQIKRGRVKVIFVDGNWKSTCWPTCRVLLLINHTISSVIKQEMFLLERIC